MHVYASKAMHAYEFKAMHAYAYFKKGMYG